VPYKRRKKLNPASILPLVVVAVGIMILVLLTHQAFYSSSRTTGPSFDSNSPYPALYSLLATDPATDGSEGQDLRGHTTGGSAQILPGTATSDLGIEPLDETDLFSSNGLNYPTINAPGATTGTGSGGFSTVNHPQTIASGNTVASVGGSSSIGGMGSIGSGGGGFTSSTSGQGGGGSQDPLDTVNTPLDGVLPENGPGNNGSFPPQTGNGTDFTEGTTPIPSETPEPASILLVGTGLAGLLGRKYLKRK